MKKMKNERINLRIDNELRQALYYVLNNTDQKYASEAHFIRSAIRMLIEHERRLMIN